MDILDGSGMTFDDAGTHQLKGLRGTRQLYRLGTLRASLKLPVWGDTLGALIAYGWPGHDAPMVDSLRPSRLQRARAFDRAESRQLPRSARQNDRPKRDLPRTVHDLAFT